MKTETTDNVHAIRAALLQSAGQMMETETIPANLKDLCAAYADALLEEEKDNE